MSQILKFHRQPMRVLVLAGGPSAERDISLESGANVAQALSDRGHHVAIHDPKDGSLDGLNLHEYDVAFIALHGTFGEDGEVQELLEQAALPYTGSNAETSRTVMSKSLTKATLLNTSLPTPESIPILLSESAETIRRKVSMLGYPFVIKPDAQGSSLGVSIVNSDLELPAALSRCFQYGPLGLLETYIVGTEWTVGVIDDIVLPPVQIVSTKEFYDYEAKYESDETKYLFETDLSDSTLETLQQIAVEACRTLGTQGIARVDFRLDRFHQPWILELNTVPGMTSHSLIPKAAAQMGLSFGEACERALESALPTPQIVVPRAA